VHPGKPLTQHKGKVMGQQQSGYMIIGLGMLGSRAVDELADFTQAAYGNLSTHGLSLMSVGFNQRTANPPVRHLTVTGELSDWLGNNRSVNPIPALQRWFDSSYYSTKRPDRLDPQTERQVARATFLRYLVNDQGKNLDTFFESGISDLRGHMGSSLVGHILVSLDDPIEACLLDLVNALYRGLAKHQVRLRLIVHLGLPGDLFTNSPPTKQSTVPEASLFARVFAALRELGRFSNQATADGPLYPPYSGLEKLNAKTPLEIWGLQIYQPDTPLAEQWVDTLLPQLDDHPGGYGLHNLEHTIYNYPSNRSAADQKLISNDTNESLKTSRLYAGTSRTRSAIFPIAWFRKHWSTQLKYELFDEWVGHEIDDIEAQQYIDDSLTRIYSMSDQETVSFPQLLRWLLSLQSSVDLGGLSARTIQDTLTEGEGLALLRDLLQAHNDSLEWMPKANRFEIIPSPEWAALAIRDLTTQVIAPDLKTTRQAESRYYMSLDAIRQVQTQRFERSLTAMIHQLLNRAPGIRGTLALLTRWLVKPLEERAQRLERVIQKLRLELIAEEMVENLQIAASSTPSNRFLMPLSRPRPDKFVEALQVVANRLKAFVGLTLLMETVSSWTTVIKQHIQHLEQWHQVLWGSSNSLLERFHDQISPFSLPATPTRFWFYEADWFQSKLNQLKSITRQAVHQQWYWKPSDQAGWVLETENDEAIAQPGHQHTYSPGHPDISLRLYALWGEMIEHNVQSFRLTLWDDFLLPQRRYNLLQPALQTFMTSEQHYWVQDSFTDSQVLIAPIALHDHKSSLLDPLIVQLQSKHLPLDNTAYPSQDKNRLVLYQTQDLFPVFKLPFYLRAREAYRRQRPDARTRLHVTVAEAEAVQWESRAVDMLHDQLVEFDDELVKLLINPERIRQFIRLETAGVIALVSRRPNTNSYCLLMPPDHKIWLGQESYKPSKLLAITDYVLGKRATVRQDQSPMPTDEAIESLLHAEFERRIPERQAHNIPFQSEEVADLIQRVSRQTQYRNSMIHAEEAEGLADYFTQLENSYPSHKQLEDRNLNRFLQVFAQVLYEECRNILRNRVH
jgi:hypothetical protein